MLLRDLGPSVVVAAVFCFIKFEFVRVVIFVCLSVYSGGVWEGNLTLPGAAIYRHWCLSYFLFPPLVRLPPVSAVTPLQAERFAWELRLHPNRQKVNFVLEGLRHGFHLGFSPSQKLKSAKKNKPSAAQHPSVVDQYLALEVSLGRVAGPFSAPPTRIFMLAALGLFLKEASPGSGASLWTFPPQVGQVSTMGLIQTNLPFIILLSIR